MRRILFGLGLALALGGPLVAIWQKERVLRHGRTLLLELAPRDPRSLMQGDYMDLNYKVATEAFRSDGKAPNGKLVLKDDPRSVGQFLRFHGGEATAPGEYLLRFRKRGWRVRLGAESFFFQEGKAKNFAGAKYGELRVSPEGDAVLVGLRGPDLQPLGPR